jgi:integrase/recombinase XerD
MTKERGLGTVRLKRQDVFRIIKRRCRQAELGAAANCHTFRATGVTAYLLNGGTLEHAQAIAAHESPRTTKLYTARPTKLHSMKLSISEFSCMVQR